MYCGSGDGVIGTHNYFLSPALSLCQSFACYNTIVLQFRVAFCSRLCRSFYAVAFAAAIASICVTLQC